MARRLILVVDDEPAIVRLIRAKLLADDFQVITANSGEACLAVLRGPTAGSDYSGPDDARDRRVRNTAPNSGKWSDPVIMLTARVADVDKLRGFQAGADDYLTKPFNPDGLTARVTAVLRRSMGSAPVGGATVCAIRGWRSISTGDRSWSMAMTRV